MKKLFVCAMALAAFVSCSKDDIQGPALDSKNKTVEITILNSSKATRGELSGVTAPGVADEGKTNMMASAKAEELEVLFADADGTILYKRDLVNKVANDKTGEDHGGITADQDGNYTPECVPGTYGEQTSNTYIWHNVPWQVTQIAVVRTNGTEADNFETLGEYYELATSEEDNLTRSLAEIVLYGVDEQLQDMNITHEVDGISYHYWKAEVKVQPWLARFEVNNIQCTDLGYLNTDANTDITKYGFDELTVNSLKWVTAGTVENPAADAVEYEADLSNVARKTMYGLYSKESEKNTWTGDASARPNYVTADGLEEAKAVWSWNVANGTKFDSMTVDLTAVAYDYSLTEAGASVPLYVVGLDGSTDALFTFDAGKIYQLDLQFVEGNVKDQDQLCVQVVVTIADWTIETVNATFGQPANSTIPQN